MNWIELDWLEEDGIEGLGCPYISEQLKQDKERRVG